MPITSAPEIAATFVGLSSEWWGVILGGVNTLLVLVGGVFAIVSLRRANLQRFNDSFRTMLNEYRDEVLTDRAPEIDRKFPIFEGTLKERLESFIEHGRSNLTASDVQLARQVIYKFNDIGSLMEHGTVLETHFFEYAHPRIITLTSRLEPLILLTSALRGQRWGMRVRRIGQGAIRCYRFSPLYNREPYSVDGVVLVQGPPPRFLEYVLIRVRKLIGRSVYLRPASYHRKQDDYDLEIAAAIVGRLPAKKLRFLQG